VTDCARLQRSSIELESDWPAFGTHSNHGLIWTSKDMIGVWWEATECDCARTMVWGSDAGMRWV